MRKLQQRLIAVALSPLRQSPSFREDKRENDHFLLEELSEEEEVYFGAPRRCLLLRGKEEHSQRLVLSFVLESR
jgi:hypothetical protein